jgi:hypothetical protein
VIGFMIKTCWQDCTDGKGREVESQGTKKAGQGSPSLFQIARIAATKGVGSLALRRCSVPSLVRLPSATNNTERRWMQFNFRDRDV